MRKVKTVDLRPGDVVVFGSEKNKVLSLEPQEGSCLTRVNVMRSFPNFAGGEMTWFNAGNESTQDVEGLEDGGIVPVESKEGLALVRYMLKELSAMKYVYLEIAEGCYDAAVGHYGYAVPLENKEVIVGLAMATLKASKDGRL